MEADLKAAKAELKVAYTEQIKAEKAAQAKQKKEEQKQLMDAIKKSGKSAAEIMELLSK